MRKKWKLFGSGLDLGTYLEGTDLTNDRFHLTKPLVTHLAFARSAPIVFAGEANVILTGGGMTLVKKTIDRRFGSGGDVGV